MANGLGKLVFAEGEIYEGEFKDDMQHGEGKYIAKLFSYSGNWKENEPSGHGIEIYNKFYVYDGCFKKGLK